MTTARSGRWSERRRAGAGRAGAAAALATAAVAGVALLTSPVAVRAQEGSDWCRQLGGHGDEGSRYCEVREQTLEPPRAGLDVDARPNGSIEVGAGGSRVTVRARVVTHAATDSEARALARQVRVETGGGRIRAQGPDTRRHEWWSVSFRIEAPSGTDLSLRAMNGGIRIRGMAGTTHFRTMNGGVHLTGLSGDVSGSTTNGGLEIVLSGKSWRGAGLDVRTTNGSVDLTVPDGYRGHLETATVNGGLDVGFPITVQGRIGRQLSVDLGGGGPTIRAVTTNGGVRLHRG